MNVGTADTAGLDLQEDFACLGGGLGNIENAEIGGLVEYGCFHGGYLRMICSIQYNIFLKRNQEGEAAEDEKSSLSYDFS
jgi:hypothetical protein